MTKEQDEEFQRIFDILAPTPEERAKEEERQQHIKNWTAWKFQEMESFKNVPFKELPSTSRISMESIGFGLAVAAIALVTMLMIIVILTSIT